MKVKLDENLPASLGEVLAAHAHDVDTVVAEKLVGHPDAEVAAAALARTGCSSRSTRASVTSGLTHLGRTRASSSCASLTKRHAM